MKKQNKIVRLGSALLASACLAVPTIAGAATFDLCAGPVMVTMPDLVDIPMWGFAEGGATAGTCDNIPTVPGPELRNPAADTGVTVTLTNTLGDPVSIVIPGQTQAMTPVFFNDGTYNRVRSFTKETASGATETYTWTNMKPGTFAYHSGTHVQVQVQMGLYGAAVLDAAAGEAYPGVSYDAEAVLLFSEIDPVLHQEVASGAYGTTGMTSTVTYVPRYFMINGQAYDPTSTPAAQSQPIGGPGSTTLLRLLNLGLRQHTAVLQGGHVRVIAEDGNPYPFVREQYSVMLAAAKTKDALLDVPIGMSPGAMYPVYDRALSLTNNTDADGGMLTYLAVGGLGGGTSLATSDPVAVDDFATTTRKPYGSRNPIVIDLLANDSDADGTLVPGSVNLLSLPVKGTITNNGDGTVTYQSKRKLGTFTLTYTVDDNDGLTSNVATLQINVTK